MQLTVSLLDTSKTTEEKTSKIREGVFHEYFVPSKDLQIKSNNFCHEFYLI
jgi:hypothetical protein